jgi:hypothetical protein
VGGGCDLNGADRRPDGVDSRMTYEAGYSVLFTIPRE